MKQPEPGEIFRVGNKLMGKCAEMIAVKIYILMFIGYILGDITATTKMSSLPSAILMVVISIAVAVNIHNHEIKRRSNNELATDDKVYP